MLDWIDNHMGLFILAVASFLLALILIAVVVGAKARMEWMEQCMKDKKEWECTAIWRYGSPSSIVAPR